MSSAWPSSENESGLEIEESQNTGPALTEHSVPLPAEKTRAGAEAGSSKRHFHKPSPKEFRCDGFDYDGVRERVHSVLAESTNGGKSE